MTSSMFISGMGVICGIFGWRNGNLWNWRSNV